MSLVKKIAVTVSVLCVLLVVLLLVFSGSIFRAAVRGALVQVKDDTGIDVSFQEGTFGFGGGVSFEGITAVESANQQKLAEAKSVQADFGWGSLFSSPIEIDRITLSEPTLTYSPALRAALSGAGGNVQVNGEILDGSVESVDLSGDPSSPFGFRLKKGEITDGKLLYQSGIEEPRVLLTQLDASVNDVSDNAPFQFDLAAELSGESKGILGLKGKLLPSTMDGDMTLSLDGFEILSKDAPWPKTDGKLSVVLENQLSHILSAGTLNMAAPPPNIPRDLTAGTPFAVNWKLDTNIADQGKGKIDLTSLSLTVDGLKGGQQALSGSGTYDPKTAQGNFSVEAREVSVPLANMFVEPSLGYRVLGGKASLKATLSRAGEKEPFNVEGSLSLAGLDLKDKQGKSPQFAFQNVDLQTKAAYNPNSDKLTLANLGAKLDDIQLNVTGSVSALQDSKNRELDLQVKNDSLDLARVVPLAMPDFTKTTGQLGGTAGVNISIQGKTASAKFPILNGNVDLKGVTFIPKDQPQMKVGARGGVQFTSDVVKGENLDLTLAEVPGKVSFEVTGYNEPTKHIKANFRGVAIEPLLKVTKPDLVGFIRGILDGDVVTTIGKGSQPEALTINYTIKDGILLTKHPVPAAIVDVIGWAWLRNGFKTTLAKGTIVQDAQGYRLDPVIFMGEKGGIALKGWIGFDNKLTATARVNVAKDSVSELNAPIQKILRAEEGSKFAFLDIPLGGTVQRPIPKLDANMVLDIGKQLLGDKAQEKLKEKLDGELGDKLGGQSDELIQGVGSLLDGIMKR